MSDSQQDVSATTIWCCKVATSSPSPIHYEKACQSVVSFTVEPSVEKRFLPVGNISSRVIVSVDQLYEEKVLVVIPLI